LVTNEFSKGKLTLMAQSIKAKEFIQKENIDYFNTFAPVTRIASIQVLFALASIHKLFVHQMDVKTAFFNCDLEKEIYITQLKLVR
jgi:folate-dependent tRNA-U54 methylase TrmFO/GidA